MFELFEVVCGVEGFELFCVVELEAGWGVVVVKVDLLVVANVVEREGWGLSLVLGLALLVHVLVECLLGRVGGVVEVELRAGLVGSEAEDV